MISRSKDQTVDQSELPCRKYDIWRQTFRVSDYCDVGHLGLITAVGYFSFRYFQSRTFSTTGIWHHHNNNNNNNRYVAWWPYSLSNTVSCQFPWMPYSTFYICHILRSYTALTYVVSYQIIFVLIKITYLFPEYALLMWCTSVYVQLVNDVSSV